MSDEVTVHLEECLCGLCWSPPGHCDGQPGEWRERAEAAEARVEELEDTLIQINFLVDRMKPKEGDLALRGLEAKERLGET
jgi:hypothetical protein